METDGFCGDYPALYIVHCWAEFTGNGSKQEECAVLQMEIRLKLSNFLTSNMFVLLTKIRHRGEEGLQEATGFVGNVVQGGKQWHQQHQL